MSKDKRPAIAMAAVILLIFAAAGAGVWFFYSMKGVRITATFASARGLVPKKTVVYKGIRIGSVVDVRADLAAKAAVALKIDSEHAQHIRQGALFVVSSEIESQTGPGILLGYCKDADPYQSPRLKSGAVVEGVDSELVFFVKTNVGCFNQTRDDISKTLDNLKKSFQDALNSPELQKLYKDLEKFFIDLDKEAQERSQRFFEKEAPEIRKKIEELVEELKRLGRDKEAEEWEKFLDEELRKEV